MTFFLSIAPLFFVCIFLCITFVFSIVEKILDWKGSVSFYTHHFSETFIAKIIPASLLMVIVLELITVVLFSIGLYQFFILESYTTLTLALSACAITLLVLLIGQRFAKDYPGAMSLGVYFGITLLGFIIIP